MRLQDEHGFTLIEVIIALAIVGILAAIALPNFLSWLPNIRLKSAARDLYSNLQKARIQAIKENRNISVRFDKSASPGNFYFDIDDNGAYTVGEYRVQLSGYKDVDFGTGNATRNWNDSAIAQASVITLSANSTANSASVFLSNINNSEACYAVTSQTSGSIKLRKYSGAVPFNKNNWK